MGKRIVDASLTHTTFDEAVSNNALTIVDWTGLLEGRPIPIKLLGNAYIQGSATGAVYRNTLLADDLYMRVSIDGGVTWRIIYLGNEDEVILDFTTDATPSIENYDTLYAPRFGQYPKLMLIIDDGSGNDIESSAMPIRYRTAGVITRIEWELGDTFTGKIILR